MKKKTNKKTKQVKLCPKCGGGYCHFCGRDTTIRGAANSWINKEGGPTHYICTSCAE